MVLTICTILLGINCLFVAPKYYPMLGYRGALYLLKVKHSWGVTNIIFGLFLLLAGINYLFLNNFIVYVIIILIGLFTTDLISFVFLKNNRS